MITVHDRLFARQRCDGCGQVSILMAVEVMMRAEPSWLCGLCVRQTLPWAQASDAGQHEIRRCYADATKNLLLQEREADRLRIGQFGRI